MNDDVLSPVQTRVKHSSGLYLDSFQAKDVPSNMKLETIVIPSTTNPAFGGYFTIDYKEKPTILKNMVLQFQPGSSLSCTGTAASYPRLIPAFYFFTRLELVINSQVIDTIYPSQQFILTQWKHDESDRIYLNNCAGNYASGQQRYTLAQQAAPSYLVNLEVFTNQIKYLCLTDSHNIQLRVYMDTLANIVDLSSNQSAPSFAAGAFTCNLLANIVRLPADVANRQLALMVKQPFDHLFHELRYGTFTGYTTSTSTQTTIVLTPIVGKCAALYFTVRATNALTNATAFNFIPIRSFQILNSGGTSIVGGNYITSQVALQYLNKSWCKSIYTCENSIGSISTGAVLDNSANVYCWSFSSNILKALDHGQCLNSYQFMGSEQLQIQWASSGTAVQIDVYAMMEAYMEQGVNYVKKISM